MAKFRSQALNIIKIKYCNAGGSGNPPSLIPTLQKISILGLKTGLWQWHNGISVPNLLVCFGFICLLCNLFCWPCLAFFAPGLSGSSFCWLETFYCRICISFVWYSGHAFFDSILLIFGHLWIFWSMALILFLFLLLINHNGSHQYRSMKLCQPKSRYWSP